METRRRTFLALTLAAALAAGSPAWGVGARFIPGGGGRGGDLLGQVWAWLASAWQSADGDHGSTIYPNGASVPPTGPIKADHGSTIDPDGFAAAATDPISSETDHGSTIDPDG